MAETVAVYPDTWQAPDEASILYKPNGFICHAQLGHMVIEHVLNAPNGAICVWSDGGDIRIMIGPKLVGDETLEEAANIAASIVGGDFSSGDAVFDREIVQGCTAVRGSVSRPNQIEGNLLVVEKGHYHWVTMAFARLKTAQSADPLPAASSLRDAYLQTAMTCEAFG